MNLNERGITVGDLLIIFLIILTSTIIVKKFNKDNKTTLNHFNREEIYQKKTLLSINYLNNFSL